MPHSSTRWCWSALPCHRWRVPPLQAKSRARNVPSGRWNVTCVGSIRRKTHPALPQHNTNSEDTSGAMEEMSLKVQNANTHSLRRQSHEHAHSSHSQFKDWFKGAMERYIWVRFAGKLTTCQTPHIAPVSISTGRWNVTHGFDSQESSPSATTHIAKVSIPVGRWNVTHGFDSRESSPPATQTYGDGQHTSGAMERYTRVRLGTKTHPALPRHTANTQ